MQQVWLNEGVLEMGKCDAPEIRDCEVDFSVIFSKGVRPIEGTELRLDKECLEFGWVHSIERIWFLDF
jgi:hypothetical protein